MIIVKGHKVVFTGKDKALLKKGAKNLGMTPQNCFTGLLWEMVMRQARAGEFKNGKKVKSKKALVA